MEELLRTYIIILDAKSRELTNLKCNNFAELVMKSGALFPDSFIEEAKRLAAVEFVNRLFTKDDISKEVKNTNNKQSTISDLEARLKEAVDVITSLSTLVRHAGINMWNEHSGATSFLTKEKTK